MSAYIRGDDLARKLNVPASDIPRMIREGLPATRIGSRIRFSIDGVNPWIGSKLLSGEPVR